LNGGSGFCDFSGLVGEKLDFSGVNGDNKKPTTFFPIRLATLEDRVSMGAGLLIVELLIG
jgi:hypothetical protein